MAKITINRVKCVSNYDKICLEICPVQVFHEDSSGKIEIKNEKNCIMCMACQVNCPCQAIEISA